MELEAIITKVVAGQGFHSFTPFPDTYLLDKRGITSATILLEDGRRISRKQQRTIFALCGFITEWAKAPGKGQRSLAETETLREFGLLYALEMMDGVDDKEMVRWQVTAHYCNLRDMARFSLSDTDMTTANDFIGWLIDVCVRNGVPCPESLLKYADDIGRYLYACVLYRRCAICGRKADIHEWDTVGMGGNRQKMHHSGQLVQPLCREHHGEIEDIGQQTFDRKYHLEAIRLDDYLCGVSGWKK